MAPFKILDSVGAEVETTTYDRLKGKDVLALTPGNAIQLHSQQWTDGRYLVCDLAYMGKHQGRFELRFYAKREFEARTTVQMAFIPGLNARMVFDLRQLHAQALVQPRSPGRLKTLVTGRRLDPGDIQRAEMLITVGDRAQWCFVTVPRLSTEQPLATLKKQAITDQFGQLLERNWPQKISSEEQLCTALRTEEELSESRLPPEYSRYGGYTNKQFDATGLFHITREGERYWLVDPEGYAYFAAGIDQVRDSADEAIVPGTEDVYSWLPKRKDEQFADCLGEHVASAMPTMKFGRANLRRCFGDDWYPHWRQLTRNRLGRWGFNCAGADSDTESAREFGLPYMAALQRYPTTVQRLCRDFPDVYDPNFASAAKVYAQQLAVLAGDKQMIGYQMGPEPAWAAEPLNLASEMLEVHPDSYARKAFAQWLSERYQGDIAALNQTWGMTLSNFEEFEGRLFHRLIDTCKGAAGDLASFSVEMCKQFITIPAQELRQIDSKHLNLGLRCRPGSLLRRVQAEFVDALMICGAAGTEGIADLASESNKPCIICDVQCGSLDVGLLGTGNQAVPNQSTRGQAYRTLFEACAVHPSIIGHCYSSLNDEPGLGRWDGSANNIGFVDVCQQPYKELAKAAAESHFRLYPLRLGQEQPVDAIVEHSALITVDLPRGQ